MDEIQAPTVEEIEMELLHNGTWKEEAKQIPLDMVDPRESYILSAYINDKLNAEDEDELKEILQKYRPALMEVKPAETMDTVKENIELIQDEKAFLEIADQFDEIQVIPFTCYINQQKVRMKFDLYPITDAKSVEDITQNLSLLKDFSEEELITYNKVQTGQELTREEIIIRADLERKLQKINQDYEVKTIREYLAIQLKFHGKDSTIEDMRKVFESIDKQYIYLLYSEVQKRNHLDDLKYEKVFQEFD